MRAHTRDLLQAMMTIIWMIFLTEGHAQHDLQTKQYYAYLSGSKEAWEESIQFADKEFGNAGFEKARALYGILLYAKGKEDKKTFNKYFDDSVFLLNGLIKNDTNTPEAMALLSSIYGLAISFNSYRAFTYGSQLTYNIKKAVELAPESPYIQQLYGSFLFYAPSLFGGDIDKAIVAYEKSLDIFPKDSIRHSWFYLYGCVSLALAYIKNDEKEKAVDILQYTVDLEPRYRWAEELLAELNEE